MTRWDEGVCPGGRWWGVKVSLVYPGDRAEAHYCWSACFGISCLCKTASRKNHPEGLVDKHNTSAPQLLRMEEHLPGGQNHKAGPSASPSGPPVGQGHSWGFSGGRECVQQMCVLPASSVVAEAAAMAATHSLNEDPVSAVEG